MDDAVPAIGVAVDGGGVPGLASRAGDAPRVQVRRYGARGCARGVLTKDLHNDLGLGWGDIAKTPDRFAGSVELAADGVTVDPSAGVAAIAYHAFQAAPGLSADLLEEEGIHRALEADVQFIDGSLRDRVDGDAVEAQVFKDSGDVGLRPRQPVQGFADHHVERAAHGGAFHGQKAGAVGDRCAGYAGVLEGADNLDALTGGEGAAGEELILDRGLLLQVAGEAGVKGRPHQGPGCG
nr:hypothetical protein [Brevundimonas pondensis]